MIKLFSILLLATVLVSGCTSPQAPYAPEQQQQDQGSQQTTPAPVTGPLLRIVTPTNGATVEGDRILVQLAASNFTLVAPGNRVSPGDGHIHVFLNGDEQFGAQTLFGFPNLQPGRYTIRAELRNSDHSQLSPPVSVTIEVNLARTP